MKPFAGLVVGGGFRDESLLYRMSLDSFGPLAPTGLAASVMDFLPNAGMSSLESGATHPAITKHRHTQFIPTPPGITALPHRGQSHLASNVF